MPKSRSLKKVHAIGSYGMRNYGDDLFVDTINERANELWPNSVVRTFAPKNLRIYSSKSLVGKILRLGTAIIGFAWSDTIALCGGSILQDVRGIAKLRQKAFSKRRLEAIGVSVGPVFDSAAGERVADLLEKVDRLIVRDKESIKRSIDLGVDQEEISIGGDLVSLNSKLRKKYKRSESDISICPSAASQIPFHVLEKQVLSGLKLVEQQLGFQPHLKILALAASETADDYPLSSELSKSLSNKGYKVKLISYASRSLEDITKELATSRMVWSQRLHGGIVSFLLDVPFLLIGHHAKCLDFASDVGLDKRTLVDPIGDWTSGIEALFLNKKQADVSAEEYIQRAEQVYLSGN